MRWKALLVFVLFTLQPLLRGQALESLVTPGRLSRAHQDFIGIDNCDKCHSPGEGATDEKCLLCHEDLALRIQNRIGFHRARAENCASCHPEHRGEEASLINWNPDSFDHSETGYELKGLHVRVEECSACHRVDRAPERKVGTSFLLLDTSCTSCHDDAHRGNLGKDCESCHSVNRAFDETIFDHSRAAFILRGAHQSVECQECHRNQVWRGLSYSRCIDCHADPHVGQLGRDCSRCHSETSWRTAAKRFDHALSRFPLVGKHSEVECRSCHPTPRFQIAAFEDCEDCHKNDPHFGQFAQDCAQCHSEIGFDQLRFDHQLTSYPLEGLHVPVECSKCHSSEQSLRAGKLFSFVRYRPLSSACTSCHEDPHLGQLEKACESCHSTDGFDRRHLNFDHRVDSEYRLSGRHLNLECDQCHIQEVATFPAGWGESVRYSPLASNCNACHRDEHAGQLQETCQECHNDTRFAPATGFSHQESRFPLAGAHRSVDCAECHPQKPVAEILSLETAREATKLTRLFRPVDVECVSCHEDPHQFKKEVECQTCHHLDDFELPFFNHFKTSFPLLGRHGQIPCDDCHKPRQWEDQQILTLGRSRDQCSDCHASPHREKYQLCQKCHTSHDWRINDW